MGSIMSRKAVVYGEEINDEDDYSSDFDSDGDKPPRQQQKASIAQQAETSQKTGMGEPATPQRNPSVHPENQSAGMGKPATPQRTESIYPDNVAAVSQGGGAPAAQPDRLARSEQQLKAGDEDLSNLSYDALHRYLEPVFPLYDLVTTLQGFFRTREDENNIYDALILERCKIVNEDFSIIRKNLIDIYKIMKNK